MHFDAFLQSLGGNEPPQASVFLTALWYDARGNWDKAHELVNDLAGEQAAWVHAYLHRKEGDMGNAGYWYHRAAKPFPSLTLEQEWEAIVKSLL